MSYHDECPKCYGPSIKPSCKDCGYDVEDALRAKVDQLAAALAEWRKHDSAPDCVACAVLEEIRRLAEQVGEDPSPGGQLLTGGTPDVVTGVAPESPVCPCCGYRRENVILRGGGESGGEVVSYVGEVEPT